MSEVDSTPQSPPLPEDLIGRTFGYVKVIEFSHLAERPGDRRGWGRRRFWRCECRCGKIRIIHEEYIRSEKVGCRDCNSAAIRERTGPRWCAKCSRLLDRSRFHKDSNTSDGLNRYCINCRRSEIAKRRERLNRRRPEELNIPKKQSCIDCGLEKSSEEFWKDMSRKSGLANICSECANTRHREWYYKNRERAIKRSRARRYGMSLEQLLGMLESQDNKCGLCSRSIASPAKHFIDHDHLTGEVRSILCPRCNTGIGHFLDSEELLLKAIDYLRKHKNKHALTLTEVME